MSVFGAPDANPSEALTQAHIDDEHIARNVNGIKDKFAHLKDKYKKVKLKAKAYKMYVRQSAQLLGHGSQSSAAPSWGPPATRASRLQALLGLGTTPQQQPTAAASSDDSDTDDDNDDPQHDPDIIQQEQMARVPELKQYLQEIAALTQTNKTYETGVHTATADLNKLSAQLNHMSSTT